METKKRSVKLKKAGYWVTTVLLCLGMISGGIAQLVMAKTNAEGMIHLGYPYYMMPILGAWKTFGVIGLWVPEFVLVKEWAYAGFFFELSGAVVSHMARGDGVEKWMAPFIFIVLVIISWRLRPQKRRLETNVW